MDLLPRVISEVLDDSLLAASRVTSERPWWGRVARPLVHYPGAQLRRRSGHFAVAPAASFREYG